MNTQYYRSLLPPNDKGVYDRILDSWNSKEKIVILEAPNKTHNSIERIVEYVALDNPSIFYVDYYRFEQTKSPFWSKLTFRFFHNHEQICRAERDIERWTNYVSSYLPAQSTQQEKLWLIYDYTARQVFYRERGHKLSHTVLGCLPKYGHAAVCEGIAKAFKMLCNAANLPCIVVSGVVTRNGGTERHAWNMIEINGVTRHIDVTSEIKRAQLSGKADHLSFLKRDVDMQGYHWELTCLPICA